MGKVQLFGVSLCCAAFLGACAGPEVEPIRGEPTFDKFGNYECTVIPGTNICIPDDEECVLADGSPCPPPPPGRGDDDDDDDSSTSGGGGSSTPGTPGRP